MACYYNEEMGIPPFATFFREQADEKREHAKQFLRRLRKHGGIVCLPIIKLSDFVGEFWKNKRRTQSICSTSSSIRRN
ncbi:ferritin, heavy subunit-like [Echinops telfairi]|uniref:Ferritin, heavy subunit-like n=1 Tax=Echinops telfairi TaxID=9371 RepID=A0AC55CQR0_ECHTE|nr:ferritin, heavy subunit-like [Echinops telfairi]